MNSISFLKSSTEIIFSVFLCLLFQQKGHAQDPIEWDGKDWKLLSSLMKAATDDNAVILVKYNNEIYEVGGFVTPDGGFSTHFKKSENDNTPATDNNSPGINASKNDVKVYPNPLTNNTTFSFPDRYVGTGQTNLDINNFPITLILYDAIGKIIKRIDNINTKEIILNKDNLPQGVYFYRATYQDQFKLIGSGSIIIY